MVLGKYFKITISSLSLLLLSKTSANALEKNLELERAYVTSCVNNGICSTDNKDVTIDNKVNLNAVVEGRLNGKRIYFSESNNLRINGRKIDASLIKKWKDIEIGLRWYKIETIGDYYSNWNGSKFGTYDLLSK